MLPAFSIARPGTLAGALELIDDDRIPYWGGTELLLAMEMGLLRPDVLVDLKGVAELTGIALDGDELVIGAGSTHAEVARSEVVREHAALLATASAKIGNARIRAQGTVASSAVISTVGSCGPPVPSVRLLVSCATQTNRPPDWSAPKARSTASRRSASTSWR